MTENQTQHYEDKNEMNTHILYPKRCDNNEPLNIDDYNKKCPFYEHPSLKINENNWADSPNISLEELHTRGVWEWNSTKPVLVTLRDAEIKFKDGKPVTPIKTGIKGRGMLGKYGPNHAVASIITKWINSELHFIGIIQNDTNEWAIPKGMVNTNEDSYDTLRRKFKEKVSSECSKSVLDEIFIKRNDEIIYAGPIYEDPRTTDSAWIEILVVHYHIEEELANKIKLNSQKSEIKNINWINCNENLYGGDKKFIDMVKEKMEYVKTEEILRAKINNENENFEHYYKVASIFAYISIVIMIIYYVLQLNNSIKTTEEYVFNNREKCILNNSEEFILNTE